MIKKKCCIGFETEILDKLKCGNFFDKGLEICFYYKIRGTNWKSIKKKLLVVWKCRLQGSGGHAAQLTCEPMQLRGRRTCCCCSVQNFATALCLARIDFPAQMFWGVPVKRKAWIQNVTAIPTCDANAWKTVLTKDWSGQNHNKGRWTRMSSTNAEIEAFIRSKTVRDE